MVRRGPGVAGEHQIDHVLTVLSCSKGQQVPGLQEAEHCQQVKRGEAFPVGSKNHRPWGRCRHPGLQQNSNRWLCSAAHCGWMDQLLIFFTCTGLCLAGVCSQADGMAKFSSSSTANSLQDTFAKDRKMESHNLFMNRRLLFLLFPPC